MKFGIVSDIHGNSVALEEILSDMDNIDVLVCAGDIIGIEGFPDKTIQKVKKKFDYVVMGNHEGYFRDDYGSGAGEDEELIVKSKLTDESWEYIHNLPEQEEINGDIYIAHSRPLTDNPSGWKEPSLNNWDLYHETYINHGETVILGHTHRQEKKQYGENEWIINPGSAGTPNNGVAEYAVYDAGTDTVNLKTVEYDASKVRDEKDGFL